MVIVDLETTIDRRVHEERAAKKTHCCAFGLALRDDS